ncbi:MAG: hypothetical protein Q9200_007760, partial [Gallowayella weberi]
NDIVRRIAVSLYEDRGGIRGLSDLLENLAVGISNGLRTTNEGPDHFQGTSISFEVYVQTQWE